MPATTKLLGLVAITLSMCLCLSVSTANATGSQLAETASSQSVTTPWSVAVEGVQLRLHIDRLQWSFGEMPALRWDVRSNGERQHIRVADGQRFVQLEVDGTWYEWPMAGRGATLAGLDPETPLEGQRVTIGPIWNVADPDHLHWRRDSARMIDRDAISPLLRMVSGKHRVRLAVIVKPSRVDTGDGFRIISEPIDIEILDNAKPGTTPWQFNGDLVKALKRTLPSTAATIQGSPRPPEEWTAKTVADAIEYATKAAALSSDTPADEPVKQLLADLKAYQINLVENPDDREEAGRALGDSYRKVIRLLAGEPEPTEEPSAKQQAE